MMFVEESLGTIDTSKLANVPRWSHPFKVETTPFGLPSLEVKTTVQERIRAKMREEQEILQAMREQEQKDALDEMALQMSSADFGSRSNLSTAPSASQSREKLSKSDAILVEEKRRIEQQKRIAEEQELATKKARLAEIESSLKSVETQLETLNRDKHEMFVKLRQVVQLEEAQRAEAHRREEERKWAAEEAQRRLLSPSPNPLASSSPIPFASSASSTPAPSQAGTTTSQLPAPTGTHTHTTSSHNPSSSSANEPSSHSKNDTAPSTSSHYGNRDSRHPDHPHSGPSQHAPSSSSSSQHSSQGYQSMRRRPDSYGDGNYPPYASGGAGGGSGSASGYHSSSRYASGYNSNWNDGAGAPGGSGYGPSGALGNDRKRNYSQFNDYHKGGPTSGGSSGGSAGPSGFGSRHYESTRPYDSDPAYRGGDYRYPYDQRDRDQRDFGPPRDMRSSGPSVSRGNVGGGGARSSYPPS